MPTKLKHTRKLADRPQVFKTGKTEEIGVVISSGARNLTELMEQ